MTTERNSETPREKLLVDTSIELLGLLKDAGIDVETDTELIESVAVLSKRIMSEFERRALGKDGEHLIFCDRNHPVEFVAD